MSTRFIYIMLSILLIIYGANTIELFLRIRKAEAKTTPLPIIDAEEISNDEPAAKGGKLKRKLKGMGKKALVLFILAWVVKGVVIVAGIFLVAS